MAFAARNALIKEVHHPRHEPSRLCAGVGPDAVGRSFWELFCEAGRAGGGNGGEAYADRISHGASFIVEVAGASVASESACLVRFRCMRFVRMFWLKIRP